MSCKFLLVIDCSKSKNNIWWLELIEMTELIAFFRWIWVSPCCVNTFRCCAARRSSTEARSRPKRRRRRPTARRTRWAKWRLFAAPSSTSATWRNCCARAAATSKKNRSTVTWLPFPSISTKRTFRPISEDRWTTCPVSTIRARRPVRKCIRTTHASCFRPPPLPLTIIRR